MRPGRGRTREEADISYMMIMLACAVFLGAAVQRVTGLGFALLASPLLVLLAGPFQGVLLANLLALIVASTVMVTSWRDADRKKILFFVPAGIAGVLPGTLAARTLAPSALQVVVGLIVLCGLGAAILSKRLRFEPRPSNTLGAGLLSGFMTATAGVGGPALTVYAVATRWEQRTFAATSQFCFAAQAITSLSLKGLPDLPGHQLLVLIAFLVAGLVLGHLTAHRIPAARARQAMITIAVFGALLSVVRGLASW